MSTNFGGFALTNIPQNGDLGVGYRPGTPSVEIRYPISAVSKTLRPTSTISSPLTPSAFAFTERGVHRPSSLINPDFVLGELIWNCLPTGFVGNVIGTNGVGWNLSNGRLSLPGQAVGGDAFTAFETNATFLAPYFGVEIPILQVPDDGTVSVLACNLVTAINGGSGRGIQLKWDRHNGLLGLYTFDSAGVTTTLSEAAFSPPAVPFTIALTYACRSLTVQLKIVGGNYYTHVRAVMPADGLYDLRLPSNIAAFKVLAIQSVQYQNTSGQLIIGNVKWGYLAGINGLADKTMKYLDGTPVQKGSSHFLVNSVQHIAASSPEGAPSATFTIQEVDPTKCSVKTRAMIFVVRTVGGVDHIEGENSGVCSYDPDNDEFVYLIPNWGDYRSGGAFGPIRNYIYRRKGFPSGIIILTGGQVFSGLPTATSDYDPDLYDDGTLLHMVYTQTNTASTWTNYGTVHVTTPRATFGAASVWTLVAAQSLAGHCEGAKFFKIGGTRYIVSTDNDARNQKVFNFSLAQLTTFAAPANTPAGIAHACMINFRDGANDRLYWLYFDNATYDGFTNTWGAIHFLENIAQQVGHDFEHRTLLDI